MPKQITVTKAQFEWLRGYGQAWGDAYTAEAGVRILIEEHINRDSGRLTQKEYDDKIAMARKKARR